MLGLSVKGYFKSHWNKLDFIILVMATGGQLDDGILLIDLTFTNTNKNIVFRSDLRHNRRPHDLEQVEQF